VYLYLNMAKKTGRPSSITPAIQEEMLLRIANGETAREICRGEDMPSWAAFCQFKRKPENESFQDQYRIALEDGMSVWETDIKDIAEDDSKDFQPDGKGGVRSDNTSVNRSKLRIDTMKWIMSKRMSKIYGDKIQQEVTGKDGAEFQPILNITIEKKG
jgi:hypothetical protein